MATPDSMLISVCFTEAYKHNRNLLKRTGEVVSNNNIKATVVFEDVNGNSHAVSWKMGRATYLG